MKYFNPDHAQLLSPQIQGVLANQLLDSRTARPPDYKAEVEATGEVVRALSQTPDTVLRTLSEAAMKLTGADSAGVSLAGRVEQQTVFLWQSAVGLMEKYLGSVVPYDESPCSSVLRLDSTVLMVSHAEAYKTAGLIEPRISELLLLPFHIDQQPVGTVWVLSQGVKAFDSEDARIIRNLSDLAALAYQVLVKLGDMELLNSSVQLIEAARADRSAEVARQLRA